MSNQRGYCKACESPLRSEIDRHFSQRGSAYAIARWLSEIEQPITEPTLRKHRAHAISPEIAALEERRPGEKPTIRPVRVSSTDFLEAVVDEGAKQIEKDPAKVTVRHALQAASVLERKKQDGLGGVRHILILALTGHTEPTTIRGTYEQLEGSN
jgi:hypothetical protein